MIYDFYYVFEDDKRKSPLHLTFTFGCCSFCQPNSTDRDDFREEEIVAIQPDLLGRMLQN